MLNAFLILRFWRVAAGLSGKHRQQNRHLSNPGKKSITTEVEQKGFPNPYD